MPYLSIPAGGAGNLLCHSKFNGKEGQHFAVGTGYVINFRIYIFWCG